tara:strand:- start:763 stop:999 length:237 start_codon:yes stop_codon:yes gene_type:complete
MEEIIKIGILVFYGFVFGYIFRLIQEYFHTKSEIPKMKKPPKPPNKNWDEYVKKEQKENLKMINDTIPETIKEIENQN